VQTAGTLDPSRASRALAWHLVECVDPAQDSAHCPQGQLLLATGGDPDGHCLLDGACVRCAMAIVPDPPAAVAVVAEPSEVVPLDS
jgi:hypothetical protein